LLAVDPEHARQERDVVVHYEELINMTRIQRADLVRDFDHESSVPAWNGPLELQLLCDGLNEESSRADGQQICATIYGPSAVLGSGELEYKPLCTTRENTMYRGDLVYTRTEGRDDPECGGHYQALITAVDVGELARRAAAIVTPQRVFPEASSASMTGRSFE
jgi:hypothetical protein